MSDDKTEKNKHFSQFQKFAAKPDTNGFENTEDTTSDTTSDITSDKAADDIEDIANSLLQMILPATALSGKPESEPEPEPEPEQTTTTHTRRKMSFQYDTTYWNGYVIWLCLNATEVYVFSEDWDKDTNNVKKIPEDAMLGMLFTMHPGVSIKYIVEQITQLVENSVSVVRWVQDKPMIRLEALWQVHTKGEST